MKYAFAALLFVFGFTANAQKKINLYIQLNSRIDGANALHFYGFYRPKKAPEKPTKEEISSLINFDEINAVIKKYNYKGMDIINELSLLGWKIQSTATPSEEVAPFIGPRIIFILSKEYEIPE